MTTTEGNSHGSFPDAKILDVDLTNKKISTKSLPGDLYKLYPGGSALGVYLMLQEMGPNIDPFSPDNLLIFAVSSFAGLPISGTSRLTISTKSPLTGGCGDSQAGGDFPAFLKANGYDAIIFRGKSNSPTYLYIDGEKIEFKDAKNVWGKITGETEEIIKKEIGNTKIEIAQIGPAGENLVKYACVINKMTRANGRNGVGAVMGSKNLKAVVVQRKPTILPYDKEGFKSLTSSSEMKDRIKGFTDGWGAGGTGTFLYNQNRSGFLPTKNYSEGFMEDAPNIDGRKMFETGILKGRETCYACAVRCKRVIDIPGKVYPEYGGPEYETLATFGTYCGVTDLETICLCNQLCNMYGLDTVSTGATIAFAMECFEKGILSIETTDGLELSFGNPDILPVLTTKIAKREGFGDFLAEGSKRCADQLGEKAIPLFMGVKGQELPAHMPQAKPGLGVIYSINPYGADHESCEHDSMITIPGNPFKGRIDMIGDYNHYTDPTILDENKIRYMFATQCFYSMNDTLGLCQFVWGIAWQLYGPDNLLDLCKYGIGWNTNIRELLEIGERRINMMRYFNAREGFTKDDDKLPERVFSPVPEGPGKGVGIDKENFSKAQEMYYKMAGWDEKTGNPTEETLKKLKLDWLLS
ncbi:MAG: aldehyde ferredoxin oxidoreductase family protein [Promethearchaeota archaeon]|jgi:aldehyde:ferredoxin oxidoreductase